MKAPDAIDRALAAALGHDEDMLDTVRAHFFKYGELCTIELDLTTMTGKVIPNK